MTNRNKQYRLYALSRELQSVKWDVRDMRRPKSFREAALRRQREIERELGIEMEKYNA